MYPKLEIIGFGAHGHVPKSEIHENEGFSGFPKINPKNSYSKMKQNNLTELLSYSFYKNCNTNGPPDALRPQNRHFTIFPEFFPRNEPENKRPRNSTERMPKPSRTASQGRTPIENSLINRIALIGLLPRSC